MKPIARISHYLIQALSCRSGPILMAITVINVKGCLFYQYWLIFRVHGAAYCLYVQRERDS